MVAQIIALLLFTSPIVQTGQKPALVVAQPTKSITLDLNSDKGLKKKFPDAVKFFALKAEVTVGEGARALTSETVGTNASSDLLSLCKTPTQIEEYAIKEVNLCHFEALAYSRVIIEVTELAYLNTKGELVTPTKQYFFTQVAKV